MFWSDYSKKEMFWNDYSKKKIFDEEKNMKSEYCKHLKNFIDKNNYNGLFKVLKYSAILTMN